MEIKTAMMFLMLALIVFVPVVMVSGCTDITSSEEASETVTDLGASVTNISDTLDEIDSSFG